MRYVRPALSGVEMKTDILLVLPPSARLLTRGKPRLFIGLLGSTVKCWPTESGMLAAAENEAAVDNEERRKEKKVAVGRESDSASFRKTTKKKSHLIFVHFCGQELNKTSQAQICPTSVTGSGGSCECVGRPATRHRGNRGTASWFLNCACWSSANIVN